MPEAPDACPRRSQVFECKEMFCVAWRIERTQMSLELANRKLLLGLSR